MRIRISLAFSVLLTQRRGQTELTGLQKQTRSVLISFRSDARWDGTCLSAPRAGLVTKVCSRPSPNSCMGPYPVTPNETRSSAHPGVCCARPARCQTRPIDADRPDLASDSSSFFQLSTDGATHKAPHGCGTTGQVVVVLGDSYSW